MNQYATTYHTACIFCGEAYGNGPRWGVCASCRLSNEQLDDEIQRKRIQELAANPKVKVIVEECTNTMKIGKAYDLHVEIVLRTVAVEKEPEP